MYGEVGHRAADFTRPSRPEDRSWRGRYAGAVFLRGVDVKALDEELVNKADGLLARTGGDDVIDAALVCRAADGASRSEPSGVSQTLRAVSPRSAFRKYVDRDVTVSLKEFAEERAALVKRLRSLDDSDWERTLTFTGASPRSTIATVTSCAWGLVQHEKGHLQQFKDRGHLVAVPKLHVRIRRDLSAEARRSVEVLTMVAADALEAVFGTGEALRFPLREQVPAWRVVAPDEPWRSSPPNLFRGWGAATRSARRRARRSR